MKNEINLEKLCTYQIWADTQVRDILKGLTEEEFTCEIGPPFKSIKNLCVHIVIAMEYNIKSCVEKIEVNAEELFESLEKLSRDELLAKWEETEKKLLETVQKVREPIEFPNFLTGGEIVLDPADFFMQYIIHTVYHRGQLISMLKILGKEGVTTDYLFYLFHLEGRK